MYNGHYADRVQEKLQRVKSILKNWSLSTQTIKSEVIFRSKASELAKAVAPLGLKELIVAPTTLIDSADTRN
ncbi:MAG: FtsL-like putative cell division protein [Ferruginibacter sp.]